MITQFQGEYRWLSNFYPVKIMFEGLEYASVEHAYMSAKTPYIISNPEEIDWKAFCLNSNYSASEIKVKSGTLKVSDEWNNVKLNVMFECLKEKFKQEPFKTKLINTESQYLQEGNRWNDKFWGYCLKTNEGENNLGKLQMKIRASLLINKNSLLNL